MSWKCTAATPAARVDRRTADALRGLGGLTTIPDDDRALLHRKGLLEADGRPTAAGQLLRHDLRSSSVVLLFAVDTEGVHRARLHVGRRRLLYVGGTGPDTAEILVYPADAVPIVLARWGRLHPNEETTDRQYGPIDTGDFWQLLMTGDPTPLLALDSGQHELWKRPWRIWGVQSDPHDISLSYLDVEGHGTYAIRHDTDQVLIRGRHSSLLWGDLLTASTAVRGNRRRDW
ncbi:hypothetical protein SAMN05421595_0343 [Austwickia chelonae]|uniref:Uncharacterized protein n=1 Tax=Austwickia chelonae NBRC 105200 TaxID=1184607 RepID=K6VM60_9MICO|nr:hypothetical protein [Austwickia chelonae]GAB77834.1 hypothetical protein AUCHE_08_00760 [Austwickia chelonae NBRC 105200]SEV90458.1 hypothetical protein SAMN05421595_0343 [Austwickia chelonae]